MKNMQQDKGICDCQPVNSELVQYVVAEMPDPTIFRCSADFYKILSSETRCRIIYALLHHELCVGDLANILSMTKSSISHQLSLLRAGGVVKCRKSGKEVYYSLADEHVMAILVLTMSHAAHSYKEGYEN